MAGEAAELWHSARRRVCAPAAEPRAQNHRIAPPCRFFQVGTCNKGSACVFTHIKTEHPLRVDTPCRFFAAGHCAHGAFCPFSHAPTHTVRAPPLQPFLPAPSARQQPPLQSPMPPVCQSGLLLHGCRASSSPPSRPSEAHVQSPAAGPLQTTDGLAPAQQEPVNQAQMPVGLAALPGMYLSVSVPQLAPVVPSQCEQPWGDQPEPQVLQHQPTLPGNAGRGRGRGRGGVRQQGVPVASYAVAAGASIAVQPGEPAGSTPTVRTPDDHTVGVAPTAEEVEASQALACGVCLDIVRPKHFFGVMSGCEHSICLACVRTWRASHSVSPEVARSCPECRTLSHHVIPSTFMPANAERKAALAHGYLRRLRTLPCKHFDFGAGTCPFGSSCFYAHVDKQGRSVAAAPRRVLVENGGGRAHALPTYRLSDFLFAPEGSEGASLLDSLPVQDLRLESTNGGD